MRFAVETAYLDAITLATKETLLSNTRLVETDGGVRVVINDKWYISINKRYRAITQVLPFALIEIELSEKVARATQEEAIPEYPFVSSDQTFEIYDLKSYFTIQNNPYFARKLVRNDRFFMKPHKIQRAIMIGVVKAHSQWSRLRINNT